MHTNQIQQALQTLQDHPDFKVLHRAPESLAELTMTSPAGTLSLLLADTETTGLDVATAKCIEVGLLLVEVDPATGRALGSYDGLQDPGEPLSREVIAVTGLTDADLAGQHFDQAQIDALINQADVIVCHNAAFDRPIMERVWPSVHGKAFVCSVKQIDWLARGFSSAKLEMLLLGMGYFYGAHRALTDCWALLTALTHPLPEHGPALLPLLQAVDTQAWTLNIVVSFDQKDALKETARFEWRDDKEKTYLPKSWLHTADDFDAMKDLLHRIHQNVFAGQRFRCQLGKVPASIRFSKMYFPEMREHWLPKD